MLERIDLGQANVVAYDIHDELTTDDIERIHNDLRVAISEHDSVRMYTNVTNLEDVDPKAVVEDMKMTPEYIADIDRYAIVGDENWHGWFTQAGNLLSKGEARYFAPAETSKAREWVCE